jgi:hypothetical protein
MEMNMKQDKERIRELARRWAEIAADPVMADRKELWRKVRDLKQVRPMILIETSCIDGFINEEDLHCEDQYLRGVERHMLRSIKQFDTLGDDIVIEPYYRIRAELEEHDFGVDVEMKPAMMPGGETSLGYSFNFPIREPEDIAKLRKRPAVANREKTTRNKALLEDVMGDILPLRVVNQDPFCAFEGDDEWTGMFFFGLTWQVFRFIGNDRLLYWVYDEPDTIHKLMEYMVEDRLRHFRYVEKEKMIAPNTDNQMAGPRFYGYVSDLPDPDYTGEVTLKHLWGWPESQEATNISPEMYKEFVLPYLARIAGEFGLVYYGCCEPVDDRIDLIMEAMPNLRAVSISGWADFDFMAERLGKNVVFSRKPTPAYMSGANPDWGLMKKDLEKTYAATKRNGCNTELLVRDLYTVGGQIDHLRKWTDLVKSIFQI